MCYKAKPYQPKSLKYKKLLETLDNLYRENISHIGNLNNIFDFYSLEDEERFSEYCLFILPSINEDSFKEKAITLLKLLREVNHFGWNLGKETVLDEIEQDNINYIKAKGFL